MTAPSTGRDGRYVIDNAKAVKRHATESFAQDLCKLCRGKFARFSLSRPHPEGGRRPRLEGRGRRSKDARLLRVRAEGGERSPTNSRVSSWLTRRAGSTTARPGWRRTRTPARTHRPPPRPRRRAICRAAI